MFTVHKYDPVSKIYMGSEVLPYIPLNSTTDAPPILSTELIAVFDNGNWLIKPKPVMLPISNVLVEGARLSDYGIYWVPKGKAWRLTADIPLPAAYAGAELIVIIERVRRDDANQVVVIDDMRPIATITYDEERGTCVLTLIVAFENYGNYRIDPARLNIGLENANKPFRLSFTPVEFDSHAATPVFTPDNA